MRGNHHVVAQCSYFQSDNLHTNFYWLKEKDYLIIDKVSFIQRKGKFKLNTDQFLGREVIGQ